MEIVFQDTFTCCILNPSKNISNLSDFSESLRINFLLEDVFLFYQLKGLLLFPFAALACVFLVLLLLTLTTLFTILGTAIYIEEMLWYKLVNISFVDIIKNYF